MAVIFVRNYLHEINLKLILSKAIEWHLGKLLFLKFRCLKLTMFLCQVPVCLKQSIVL